MGYTAPPMTRALAFTALVVAPLALPLGCNLIGKKTEDAGAAPTVAAVTTTAPTDPVTQPDPGPAPTGLSSTKAVVPVPRVVLTDAGKPLVVDGGLVLTDAGAAPKSDAAGVPTPTIKPPAVPTGFPTTIPTGLKIPTSLPTTLPTWPPK